MDRLKPSLRLDLLTEQTPRNNHASRVYAYLVAMTELFPDLSMEEQNAFHQWRELPTSRRDSDWPGWAKYIGPRPVNLQLMERSA